MTEGSRRQDPPWDPGALPAPTTDERVMHRDLRTFGYCIIENAIAPGLVRKIRIRLTEQAGAERRIHGKKNPANMHPANQWVGMLLNKGPVFVELLRQESCMGLFEHLLGKDYLISCVDAQIQHPGAGCMPLHTDQWWMPEPVLPTGTGPAPAEIRRGSGKATDPRPARRPISPIAEANIMWMVTDFTENNGATRVVPGSHLSGRQPDASIPHRVQTVAATGPAGTAMAFDGRLWHGAAENRTAESRLGITTAACGPQFRQIENYPRGLRPDMYDRCGPELLSRLGFRPWSGYGHTGDPDTEVSNAGAEVMGELR